MDVKSALFEGSHYNRIVHITTNKGESGFFAPFVIAKSNADKRNYIVFGHLFKDTNTDYLITDQNVNRRTYYLKDIDYVSEASGSFKQNVSGLFGFTGVYDMCQ
jgi:hypothetical protein